MSERSLIRSQLIALSSFKSAFELKSYAKYWRFIAATIQQHECQLVVDFISFFLVVVVAFVLILSAFAITCITPKKRKHQVNYA